MNASQRYRARKKAEASAHRRARARLRDPLSEAELAWAAGMFEGDGTATITTSGGRTRPIVTLANTDREIVDFFQARWPGVVREKRPSRSTHRTAWVWTLNSNGSVEQFLTDVLPYLRTTRRLRLAVLVAADCRGRAQGMNGSGAGNHDVVAEVRQLNQRGENHG